MGGRVDKIETTSTPQEITPLAIPLPSPIKLSGVEWIIVTPANVDEIMEQAKAMGREQVFFALSPAEYQRLSLDLAEIRKYINNQRAILIRYQDYYEGGEDARPRPDS